MGIKDPTLSTLQPIHKEQIFVSYNLEISQGRNLKNLPRIGIKYVHNYLSEAASHATNNGQCDPRLGYTLSSLPPDDSKPFPILKKLLSHMSKWTDGRDEALPLTTDILRYIEVCSLSGVPLPMRHVSSTPFAWVFKQVLGVANNAGGILFQNPKNSTKSPCPPTQAPS